MSIEQSVTDFFRKNERRPSDTSPEGICPNCWGTQEYSGKFYEAARNYNADANTKNPNIGWIRDYVNKHLVNISLHPHKEGVVCENCKVVYKEKK
jgi:hypothetical protein